MNDDEPNPGLDRVRHELRSTGVPFETPNPLRAGVHTRGYLPHVKREGSSYFTTFRLADSLPQSVLLDFKRQQSEKIRSLKEITPAAREEIDRDYQRMIERYLDRGIGECHLRRPEIAKIAADTLLYYHEKQYVLHEWVVMPNHIHVFLWPMPNYTLSDILRDRKRRIAREANIVLGRTGKTFWQHESYDHWIRNDYEKARIRRYIRNNPVSAKLCNAPEDWVWGSAYHEAAKRKGQPRPNRSK